jgi:hypothetical protein
MTGEGTDAGRPNREYQVDSIAKRLSLRAEELGYSKLSQNIGQVSGVPPRVWWPVGQGRLMIMSASQGQEFAVQIWQKGYCWIHGKTSYVDDVIQLAVAWESGITLSEARKRWPFLKYDELAAAHEAGNVVPVQWGILKEDPDINNRLRGVINLASSREKLRILFPWVGQVGTRFGLSRCTGYPYTNDIPVVDSLASSFRLTDTSQRRVVGEYAMAVEVVDFLDNAVPGNFGPATIGTIEDVR